MRIDGEKLVKNCLCCSLEGYNRDKVKGVGSNGAVVSLSHPNVDRDVLR